MNNLKVIAFDVFNTVVNISNVPKNELRAYSQHLKHFYESGHWEPLSFPASWDYLPPHPDSIEGINRLRKKYSVVAMSNAPMHMMVRLCKNSGLFFDAVVPLELRHTFKPSLDAFRALFDCFRTSDILMVSANESFGDIEAAREFGLQAQLIRNPGCPQTITALAEELGC